MAKTANNNISYNNIMNQINALTKKAQMVREKEASSVVANIRQQMEKFGLTVKDLQGASNTTTNKAVAKAPAKKAESKKIEVQANTESETMANGVVRKNKFATRRKPDPKFMNPETGETWTGRGKTPKWLQGRRKSRFAITNALNA
jgi:DNA-binding protein H-NS